MGRDKAALRFGKTTMLRHIRALAKRLELPVRIIRRDLVPRCGPLGGVYTALKTTKAHAVLFLACDMPFVSEDLLRKIGKRFLEKRISVFTKTDIAGFPFVMATSTLPVAEKQLAQNQFSLQLLAQKCEARFLRIPKKDAGQLFNINTREDWKTARCSLKNFTNRTALSAKKSANAFCPETKTPPS
jgi:molybdopterin-guanine dinucleotide biosynthesis protein A